MLSNLIAALALAAALGATGCEATFTPANPVVPYRGGRLLAPAEVVPADIWAYPHVVFGGRPVYLVDGLWYAPTSRGWMIYRREPVELSRERTRIYASQPYNFRLRINPRANPRNPEYGYPGESAPPGSNAYPGESAPPPPQPPVEYNRERNYSYPAPPY